MSLSRIGEAKCTKVLYVQSHVHCWTAYISVYLRAYMYFSLLVAVRSHRAPYSWLHPCACISYITVGVSLMILQDVGNLPTVC